MPPTKQLYTVFVSSTFADLEDARKEVIRAILRVDCFPAGMEHFAASSRPQWDTIESFLAVCDYYVVIVGNRYGSIDDDGVSFTEREYEYALENGIPVLAFIHSAPDKLKNEQPEVAADAPAKLAKFRARLQQNRLCAMWSDSQGLALDVCVALTKEIASNPRGGWIRAAVIAEPASIPSEETFGKPTAIKYPAKMVEAVLNGEVIMRRRQAGERQLMQDAWREITKAVQQSTRTGRVRLPLTVVLPGGLLDGVSLLLAEGKIEGTLNANGVTIREFPGVERIGNVDLIS